MPTEPRYSVAAGLAFRPGAAIEQPTASTVIPREQSPLDVAISQLEREIDQLYAELNFFYVKLEPFMCMQPPTNEKEAPSHRPGVSPIVVHLCALGEKVGAITSAVIQLKARLEL